MMVVKRNRETGKVVPIAILMGGHVQKPTPAPIKVEPVKATKAKSSRPEGRVSMPKNASEGEALAFKLHNALCETDMMKRNKLVFSCGKLARDIGLGDPDVAVAYEAAKRNQKTAVFQENVESDLFNLWGTYFIGGFTAKRITKSTGLFKPYVLVVEIPGEEGRSANYATQFEAYRAACRWWTQKSERGQHATMHIEIRNTEPVETEEGTERVTLTLPSGKPDIQVVSYDEAASLYQSQVSREKHGPVIQATSKPRSHAFGVKVKETKVTFSSGHIGPKGW